MKKLKKKICLILCLMIAAAGVLAGCGGSSGGTSGGSGGSDAVQSSNRADQTGGVQQVLEAGMQEAGEEAEAAPEEEPAVEEEPAAVVEPEPETEAADEAGTAVSEDPETAAAATDVDVDLTVLSATMVYSEVFNMMTKPEEYIGKSIRMRGEFSYFLDESSGNEYFACIIRDATACCATRRWNSVFAENAPGVIIRH